MPNGYAWLNTGSPEHVQPWWKQEAEVKPKTYPALNGLNRMHKNANPNSNKNLAG